MKTAKQQTVEQTHSESSRCTEGTENSIRAQMNRVNSFYEKVLYDSLQEAHYRNIRMRKSFFNPTSESNLGFLHDTGRAAECSISQAAMLEFVNQPKFAAEACIV